MCTGIKIKGNYSALSICDNQQNAQGIETGDIGNILLSGRNGTPLGILGRIRSLVLSVLGVRELHGISALTSNDTIATDDKFKENMKIDGKKILRLLEIR